MAQSLEQLAPFVVPGKLNAGRYSQGLSALNIELHDALATVFPFGAQICAWAPRRDSVLWLAENPPLDGSRPIRGGIPVCWPWFGGHPDHADWPSHGIARTSIWTVDSTRDLGSAVEIRCSLPVIDAHRPYWPHQSRPTITHTIGETLTIELTTTNIDPHPIPISQALHTYFEVSDIAEISITGLEACAYIDKLTGREEPPGGAPIAITTETDRIYRRPPGTIRLHDAGTARTITIAHEGASSAVVWNPWIEKSARMGDMGPADAYRGMVCIETGNVAPDGLTLAPGETHTLKTTISLAKNTV